MRAIPNALSIFRLALALPIAALIFTETPLARTVALALFGVGVFTDMLDGLLARALSARTALGSHLDPLADKALILLPLAALAIAGQLTPLALGAFLVLLVREGLVAGLRIVRLRTGAAGPAGALAKIKTAAAFIGAGLVLAARAYPAAQPLAAWGNWSLAGAAALAIVSAPRFFKRRG